MALAIVIALGVVLLSLFLFKKSRRISNLPGPSPLLSLPLIGHGHLLGKEPIKNLLKFRKVYGDVFRLDVGSLKTVFLCNHQLISHATKSDLMTGRPFTVIPSFYAFRRTDSRGNLDLVAFMDGPVWREQRKFMLQQLSDLGMGNTETMEDIITQEAEDLAVRMKKICNQKMHVNGYFRTTVNNVIWRILRGKPSKQDDPELTELTRRIYEFSRTLNPGSIFSLMQRSSVTFLKMCSLLGIRNAIDIVKPVYAMMDKEFERKEAHTNGSYIERCREEMERNKDNPNSSFHGRDGYIHTVGAMYTFFAAGTDTTSSFLEWAILYLCQYPDIQEKVHHEIKDCFGVDGNVSLKDDFRLPFVEATIDEICRHCPLTVLTLPHMTVGDLSVGGYLIPKGTQVFSFMTTVHMDPTLFKNPEEFNPSRFIDSNGRFQRSDHVLFFGQGKRRCLGEKLGRAETFLFFVTIFQKFKFSKVKDLDFKPVPGLLFNPQSFDVLVELRQ